MQNYSFLAFSFPLFQKYQKRVKFIKKFKKLKSKVLAKFLKRAQKKHYQQNV